MRRKNDILWKGILEWVFDDLLRFVYPNADEVFDLQRGFGFLDKELAEMHPEPEGAAKTRFVDKLVKVYRKEGGEEWILIHIEVQGQTRKNDRAAFPERMFHYFIRCFDRYHRPIAAIAIFTGPDGRQMPGKYEYSFLTTRLQYEYHTLCISAYEDQELGDRNNPFAWVVLAAKKALLQGKDPDEKLLEGKLFIFRKLFDNGLFQRRNLQAILKFMEHYIRFENPENNRKFMYETDKITGKKNTMDIFEQVKEIRLQEAREEGLLEGKIEGRTEEKLNIARNLLTTTEFDVRKIAELIGAPVSFIKKVKAELEAK